MTKNRSYLLILPLICCNTISFGQSISIYETASKEYFQGDLNKAIALFTKSIENGEEIAKSYMYRGAAESFLNNFTDALADLNSSFKLDSLNDKIYYYYGKLYLFQGEYNTAIRYYSIAILKNPKYPAAYDERAVANSLLGDFEAAINDENTAIGIDSANQLYYTDRGFAKLKLGKYEAAIKDFDISLKLQVNQKAYADRGYAYSLIGLHLKAIEDYTKSLEINSQDGEVYYYRGISYSAIGRKNEACNDLSKSKKLGYTQSEELLTKLGCGQ